MLMHFEIDSKEGEKGTEKWKGRREKMEPAKKSQLSERVDWWWKLRTGTFTILGRILVGSIVPGEGEIWEGKREANLIETLEVVCSQKEQKGHREGQHSVPSSANTPSVRSYGRYLDVQGSSSQQDKGRERKTPQTCVVLIHGFIVDTSRYRYSSITHQEVHTTFVQEAQR